jgi:hypothetical protein
MHATLEEASPRRVQATPSRVHGTLVIALGMDWLARSGSHTYAWSSIFFLYKLSLMQLDGFKILCYALSSCHNILRIGFRESQTLLTLTNFTEKTINIYNTEYVPYRGSTELATRPCGVSS